MYCCLTEGSGRCDATTASQNPRRKNNNSKAISGAAAYWYSVWSFCPLFISQPHNPAVMSRCSSPGVPSLPRSLTSRRAIIRDKGASRRAGRSQSMQDVKNTKRPVRLFWICSPKASEFCIFSTKRHRSSPGTRWNSSRPLIGGVGRTAAFPCPLLSGRSRLSSPPNLAEERRECKAE